ncbi:MAG: glycoside hydrolase family 99-like domain-containing protein [Verrucomicrobia bacterium]|nr:glycoside hydrolase family 99-like domain-containing protein [Verrucomicrobiota bacterium]
MTHQLATLALAALTAVVSAADHDPIRLSRFLPDHPISRARRPTPVVVVWENTGEVAAALRASLIVPPGVRIVAPTTPTVVVLEGSDTKRLVWQVEAEEATRCELRLQASAGPTVLATATLAMDFLPPMETRKLPYIPEPVPARTKLLVGAHHCPLWEADKPHMWANIVKHPERTPALGFYAQENPEVSDWETKWAVEHGISFFVYCWYRTSQGGAVRTQFGSAIHDGLFKSRFADKMKFTIMWENQSRVQAGVADERDLFSNLLPYWMTNYFQHPSYLKVDGKPLLFIYRPEFLVQDLGGVENVKKAFARMRQQCREAGFAGLWLLGEYRGLDPKHLTLMKQLGLDETFAYCWHVPNSPAPAQAIQTQMDYIRKTQQLGILPQVVTVSQAWSGWRDEGSIWKIPPREFETLLRQAKDFVGTLPASELGSKMLLLDNWNEWGEGHYLAPYREFGFGYVDAVRRVLSDAPEPHTDLIPEDIGMGPYDTAYKTQTQITEQKHKLLSKKVTKPGATEEGLVAWWAFDEPSDSPVALDYSGHRLGGMLRDAARTNGIDGLALVCGGGCALIENHRLLSPTNAISLECWVKTDVAGQDNHWFVNRVLAGGTSTGYRLGVLGGKACFEVPQQDWSHHLQAIAPLPVGRWVHVAGTFDGKLMRIYVYGEERGSMERPGPVKPNEFRVCLGGYEAGHRAHFTGLLDEVKLFSRALSGTEVRAHYQALSKRADSTAQAGH